MGERLPLTPRDLFALPPKTWKRRLSFRLDVFKKSLKINLPQRERRDTPNMDLVTWTLGNDAVPMGEVLLYDAADPSRNLSKHQVVALVRRLVAGLRFENGGSYLDGRVVCVHAFNNIFYPVFFQGILGSGGCFTGTNPAYTSSELEHHFRKSETRFIITGPSQVDRVLTAAHKCGIPESHIFVFDYEAALHFVVANIGPNASNRSPIDSAHASMPGSPDPSAAGCRPFIELLQHGESKWLAIQGRKQSAATPAGLFSTSGTSGLPKIAARTHASMIAESIATQGHIKKPYKQIRLLSVPFFHAFGSPLGNVGALRDGVPTYIMPRFSEPDFVNAVERYEITETALVPPVILNLLAHCTDRLKRQLQSVRIIWCGGAPLDPQTQEKANTKVLRSHGHIAQVWGLTECGWLTTFSYPEKDTTGAVGRLLPGYRSRLLDEEDREVHEGRGEIVISSPAMMSGYLCDNAATKAAFTKDGWYRTGDIGEIRGGKIYIVDRKKELIKVRGWQVAPAELEGILVQYDQIVDAAVIGVPAKPGSTEEIPEAYVVRAKGSTVSENDVKGFLLRYLAKYKVMDCRVVFTDRIPKSASGKILRKVLRERRG